MTLKDLYLASNLIKTAVDLLKEPKIIGPKISVSVSQSPLKNSPYSASLKHAGKLKPLPKLKASTMPKMPKVNSLPNSSLPAVNSNFKIKKPSRSIA